MATERAGLILPDIFFEREVIKLKEEARQQGFSAGLIRGIESTIMCIHHRSGFSAEQIVTVTGFTIKFVQETP
jgi:hypothetical protein